MAAALAGVLFLNGGADKEVSSEIAGTTAAVETTSMVVQNEVEKETEIEKTTESAENTGEMVMVDLSARKEELGEQIVFYEPKGSITTTLQDHVLFCMPDGTVKARGSNLYGQCMVEEWDHVVAVAANAYGSFGLRSDGTVLYTGADELGLEQVELWDGIISIQAGSQIAVGLKEDGTVVAAHNGQDYMMDISRELETWNDIKSIAAMQNSVYGLKEDGTVLCAGDDWILTDELDWEDVDELITCESYAEERYFYGLCEDGSVKTQVPAYVDYLGEEYFEELGRVKNLSQLGGPIGVKEDGTIWNDTFNLNMTEVLEWDNLFSVAVSSHTGGEVIYGITKDGELLEYGFNNGNSELKDLNDVQWVRTLEGNSIIAYTNQDELLVSGVNNNLMAYDWVHFPANREGEKFLDCAGRSFVDGNGNARIVVETDGMEEVDKIPGVKYMVEVWNGIRWQKPGCVYVMVMEDQSTQIYVYGDTQDPDLSELLRYYDAVAGAENWKHVVQITDYTFYGIYGLMEDGTVWESRNNAQLDTGDKKIVQICANASGELLGLGEDGTICVIKKNENFERFGMHQAERWEGIEQIVMGESHVAGLRADGTVIATGQNYTGQCDVEEWTDIVRLAAGKTCTIGIDKNGQLLIAGSLY